MVDIRRMEWSLQSTEGKCQLKILYSLRMFFKIGDIKIIYAVKINVKWVVNRGKVLSLYWGSGKRF